MKITKKQIVIIVSIVLIIFIMYNLFTKKEHAEVTQSVAAPSVAPSYVAPSYVAPPSVAPPSVAPSYVASPIVIGSTSQQDLQINMMGSESQKATQIVMGAASQKDQPQKDQAIDTMGSASQPDQPIILTDIEQVNIINNVKSEIKQRFLVNNQVYNNQPEIDYIDTTNYTNDSRILLLKSGDDKAIFYILPSPLGDVGTLFVSIKIDKEGYSGQIMYIAVNTTISAKGNNFIITDITNNKILFQQKFNKSIILIKSEYVNFNQNLVYFDFKELSSANAKYFTNDIFNIIMKNIETNNTNNTTIDRKMFGYVVQASDYSKPFATGVMEKQEGLKGIAEYYIFNIVSNIRSYIQETDSFKKIMSQRVLAITNQNQSPNVSNEQLNKVFGTNPGMLTGDLVGTVQGTVYGNLIGNVNGNVYGGLTNKTAILKITDNNTLLLVNNNGDKIWESNSPPKTWQYIGCYKDNKDSKDNKDRTIPGGFVRVNYPKGDCEKIAKSKNHDMYAIQDGNACFTGTKNTLYKKLGVSNNCKNGTGGSWANDVFVLQ